jgi:hypothetical protein
METLENRLEQYHPNRRIAAGEASDALLGASSTEYLEKYRSHRVGAEEEERKLDHVVVLGSN